MELDRCDTCGGLLGSVSGYEFAAECRCARKPRRKHTTPYARPRAAVVTPEEIPEDVEHMVSQLRTND